MNNLRFVAESKNVKVSPRKMRLVVDGVKNLSVTNALAQLSVVSNRSAVPIRKTIASAIANAVNNGKVNKDDLIISEMFVNEGIVYKRNHFAGRGRIRPYKKRASHLKVILEVKETKAVALPLVEEKKGGEEV